MGCMLGRDAGHIRQVEGCCLREAGKAEIRGTTWRQAGAETSVSGLLRKAPSYLSASQTIPPTCHGFTLEACLPQEGPGEMVRSQLLILKVGKQAGRGKAAFPMSHRDQVLPGCSFPSAARAHDLSTQLENQPAKTGRLFLSLTLHSQVPFRHSLILLCRQTCK